jgi:DNA-binding MarR family transcriptional regulator
MTELRPATTSLVPWLLRRVNQRYRMAIRAELTARGFGDLPQPGYWAVTALAGGASDASHLIAQMGVTKQAVSKLVETLVASGYIDRRPNHADRRRSDLLLTARGRKAVDIIESAVRATERSFVAEIGDDSFARLRQSLDELASSSTPPDNQQGDS